MASNTATNCLRRNGNAPAYKPKYRQEYRQNKELPLLEEYYAWLNTVHPEKGSKLEEAVRYSLNQKQQLTALANCQAKCNTDLRINSTGER